MLSARHSLLVAAFALLPAGGHTVGLGQSRHSSTIEEIVVVGTRTAGSATAVGADAARDELSRIPGAIGFVEAENYADDFAQSIGDTLVFTPGVFADTSAQRENRISVRGSGLNSSFERRGVSLFRDGIPITRASGSTEFQEVDPRTIQYIEVYKGANALRYGGSALGGVINMITPTGRTTPYQIEARLEGGSFDTRRGSVSIANAWDQVDVYAAYTRLTSDGFRDHSAVDSHYAFTNVGWQINDRIETRTYLTVLQDHFELAGSLSLEGALKDETRAGQPVTIGPFFPGGPVTVLDPGPIADDWDRNLDVVRLSNVTSVDLATWSINGGLWYSTRKLDHAITRFAGIIDQNEDEWGVFLRAKGSFPLHGRQAEWTVGIETNKAWNDARTWANAGGHRGALRSESEQLSWNGLAFAQIDLPITSDLNAVIGLQATRSSRENRAFFGDTSGRVINSQLNPRLGVLWSPQENVALFANINRGFEPASMADLTAGGALDFTPLKAQSAWTAEIGSRGQFGPVSWDVALYQSKIKDELLDYGVAGAFGFLSFTDNASDTLHRGIEAGLDIRLFDTTFARRGLSLLWRHIWSFNDFRFDDDPIYTDNRLAGVPLRLYVSELRLSANRGWYFSVNTRVVPEGPWVDFANTTRSPDYTLWGVTAGWDIDDGVRIFISGENITDKRYISNTGTNANQALERSRLYTPGQGRAWFGGITLRL